MRGEFAAGDALVTHILDHADYLSCAFRPGVDVRDRRTQVADVTRRLPNAVLDGRWMVRVSIGSALTEREDVVVLWELMRQKAEGQ